MLGGTMIERRKTREVRIGDVVIGGTNPIAIQSMTNTETSDVAATVAQILALEKAGCEIIRSTANTEAAADAFDKIKEQIHIPIVADIHFDYRLAIRAMEHGADKIRINPGNIGGPENLKKVVDAAKHYRVPIRVGVNSGSLEKNLVEKYGGVTAEGIVESAMDKVRMLEELDFHDIVISIKSSEQAGEPADRLSPACGDHGIRHALEREYQVLRGTGYDPGRRDRRYHSRVPVGRPGGRGENGEADPQDPGDPEGRDHPGQLSYLRKDQDRSDRSGK